jgi:hypothetical protein
MASYDEDAHHMDSMLDLELGVNLVKNLCLILKIDGPR